MSERVREITWVAQDAKLRFTSGGKQVLEFRAKVNGEYRTVVYWPETEDEGGYLADTLKKDQLVGVVGKTHQREWTGQDGEERVSLEVKAYHVGPMYGQPYKGNGE